MGKMTKKVMVKDRDVGTKKAKNIKGGPIYMELNHGLLLPAINTQKVNVASITDGTSNTIK